MFVQIILQIFYKCCSVSSFGTWLALGHVAIHGAEWSVRLCVCAGACDWFTRPAEAREEAVRSAAVTDIIWGGGGAGGAWNFI